MGDKGTTPGRAHLAEEAPLARANKADVAAQGTRADKGGGGVTTHLPEARSVEADVDRGGDGEWEHSSPPTTTGRGRWWHSQRFGAAATQQQGSCVEPDTTTNREQDNHRHTSAGGINVYVLQLHYGQQSGPRGRTNGGATVITMKQTAANMTNPHRTVGITSVKQI